MSPTFHNLFLLGRRRSPKTSQSDLHNAQMTPNVSSRHGKLTKTVKNPNYRGISNPFWNSLKMAGNKDTFEMYGTPYCGKGEPNQAIRVGHASPVCLFENVEIFGGI